MSTNCVKCVKNERTGLDLLCDKCRATTLKAALKRIADDTAKAIMHGILGHTMYPPYYMERVSKVVYHALKRARSIPSEDSPDA